MPSPIFPLFPRFPTEIRLMIWRAAIPSPRIISITETRETSHDFYKQHTPNSTDISKCPGVQYFLQEQETRITGFWQGVPDFNAYDAFRKGYLHSPVNIPTLFHVCRESRQIMLEGGYKLTFSTRSNGPRTWFDYQDDVLYLEHSDVQKPALGLGLDNTPWGIGQFLPRELNCVKRMGLEIKGFGSESGMEGDMSVFVRSVKRAVGLFAGLEEVLLVIDFREVKLVDKDDGESTSWVKTPTSDACGLINCREEMLAKRLDLFEKIMAGSAAESQDRRRKLVDSFRSEMQTYRVQNPGTSTDFIEDRIATIEELLGKEHAETVVRGERDWNVPRVRIVVME